MFYQVGLLPVTNNLLDNSSDFYLTVYGMIRSDRLIIQGSCVQLHCTLFITLRGTTNPPSPTLLLTRPACQC